MGTKDISRNGKRKVREPRWALVALGDPTAISFGIMAKPEVSARRKGVTSLNMQRAGANLGHRALSWFRVVYSDSIPHRSSQPGDVTTQGPSTPQIIALG